MGEILASIEVCWLVGCQSTQLQWDRLRRSHLPVEIIGEDRHCSVGAKSGAGAKPDGMRHFSTPDRCVFILAFYPTSPTFELHGKHVHPNSHSRGFAVKYRAALIMPSWKDELLRYITGIVQKPGTQNVSDKQHARSLHMLFGMRPVQSLSELMRIVKSDSSEWINKQQFIPTHFRWQEGYGAFSYAKSTVKRVAVYIERQEQHYRNKSFSDEYKEYLRKFEVNFDSRYIFNYLG